MMPAVQKNWQCIGWEQLETVKEVVDMVEKYFSKVNWDYE